VAHAQEKSVPPQNLDDITWDQIVDDKMPIDADRMLAAFASRLRVPIEIDPQMVGTKIKFTPSDAPLTWGVFKKVLDFYDIVVEEKEVDGRWLMLAHLRRNIAQRAGPPFKVIEAGEELPKREEIVTAVVQVKHGAGNDIFATVRGLLVRDVNRIGNILYVRGPEVIIFVDFAPNVDYYTKIVKALDVPAPRAATKELRLERAMATEAAAVLDRLYGATPVSSSNGSVISLASAPPAPRIVPCARTNTLFVQASASDLAEIERVVSEIDAKASPLAPAARSSSEWSPLWPLTTVLAMIAFLGQTLILRRIQARFGLKR
jgi:hypothetical protein